MKQRITTVLVTAKDTGTLKRIKLLVLQTLPNARVNECLGIDRAIDAFDRGRIDLCIISREMIHNHSKGEHLVKSIREVDPDMFIIFHSEVEDVQYEWSLYKKYKNNIECIVRDKTLHNLTLSLTNIYGKLNKFTHQRYTISKVGYRVHVDLHEIIKITVGESGRIDFALYSWENKTWWQETTTMTLKKFLEEDVNNDFIRVNKSEAINVYTISRVDDAGRFLELMINDAQGEPIVVDIGDEYYQNVLERMKGWY